MSKTAIVVNGLSKRYRLRSTDIKVSRQSKMLKNFINTMLEPLNYLRFSISKPTEEDTIWSLKDVSFKVDKGEVVGIIGANGAGKSTLLKILSRITRPTRGYAELTGRVGALIEVGTGFHPELTGRENVYLNGTILGLRRKEVEKRFDEIVDFSGVEKFIDTPVKYFSSGMKVRLGFAVAAHLEPEILIIDEVLSVGDAEFRNKSIGKLDQVAKGGRTVMIVSHNLAIIENLCERSILLDSGKIVVDGSTGEAISTYLSKNENIVNPNSLKNVQGRGGNGNIRFTYFEIQDKEGKKLSVIPSGRRVKFVFGYEVRSPNSYKNVVLSFTINTQYDTALILHRSDFNNQEFNDLKKSGEFVCDIPSLPLATNSYLIRGIINANNEIVDDCPLGTIEVVESDYFGSGKQGIANHSPILIKGDWNIE